MAQNEKIRIRLKSYDHKLLDFSAAKIVETAKKSWITSFRTCATTNRKANSNYIKSCTQVQRL